MRKGLRMKPSITTVLVAGFGLLILVGMMLVLGISMWSARENTRTLIRDNAKIGILSLARAIRSHLEPAEEASTYIAEMIYSGRLDLASDDRLGEILLATAAPAPQIFGLGFVHADGRFLRVRRGRGALKGARASDFEGLSDLLAKAHQLPRRPFWSELAGLEEINATLIEAWMPVWKDDSFVGLLVSTVSASDLSRFIARSDGAPLRRNRFILYGRITCSLTATWRTATFSAAGTFRCLVWKRSTTASCGISGVRKPWSCVSTTSEKMCMDMQSISTASSMCMSTLSSRTSERRR